MSVRKEQLEGRFVELLNATWPRPEFMRLFREIVLDVRKERKTPRRRGRGHAIGPSGRAAPPRDAAGGGVSLRREDRRADVRAAVGRPPQLRHVRDNRAGKARADDLDVAGLLRFSEDVLCNAAPVWMDAPAEQKLRLQAALFPQGLRMRDGASGTVVTTLAPPTSGRCGSNSGLASQICASWNQLDPWLRAVDGLRSAG